MKINLSNTILNFEGEEQKDEQGKVLTYGRLIRTAMNIIDESDKPSDKMMKFDIALKASADEADFTVDELAKIKEVVGKYYNPLIYGRLCQLVDS